MPLDITVSHDRCVGSTMCLQFAAGVFELDDDGQSVVADATGADRDTILEAAANCPTEAIEVTDGETGEELFP